MSILVKTDGTAVAEEKKTTAPAAAADDGSDKVKAGTTAAPAAKTETPEAAKLGVSSNTGVDFSALTQEYEGKYDAQLADLYNQITQRKPFTYNSNDDMLYQQYVDRYTKGGQLAMEDSMGQAAALTGGYGNSYAQRVGQQTYDEYMTGLNDMMLELEERAYGRWQDEGDRMLQQYGMLGDLADTDYNRWKDGYGMAADQYDRYMAAAALRASAGDFGAYEDLFGDDARARMQAVWAAQNLMPLYKAGQMDAETYKQIAGVYPVGYNPNSVVSGGGGWDGGVWGPSSGSGEKPAATWTGVVDSVSKTGLNATVAEIQKNADSISNPQQAIDMAYGAVWSGRSDR